MAVSDRSSVSVIIPTYCSTPHLPALTATLEAQSMDSDLMEVIFVDDGSPDDTFNRLGEVCEGHQSWSVHRIENTGWPSIPRNRGIDRAHGDYVFFMDHDDRLHERAIEAMAEYADRHQCDVVIGKETVSGPKVPRWNCFKADTELAQGQLTPDALVPITPHKLYRRSFLDQHQIRFPENHKRIEDFAFNGRVYAAGARVGILSSVPCYDWLLHDGNTHTSSIGMKGYWGAFDNSVAPILALPQGGLRDSLLTKWFRGLFMVRLAQRFGHYAPPVRERLWKRMTARAELFPPTLDAGLPFRERAVAELFRQGNKEGVLGLWQADRGMRLRITSVETWRRRNRIDVQFTGHIGRRGERLAVRHDDGRLVRSLPDELAEDLSINALQLDECLKGTTVEFQIRNQTTGIDWPVPGSGSCTYSEDENGGFIEVCGRATLDTRMNVFGDHLEGGFWDLFARVDALGFGGAAQIKRGHEYRRGAEFLARSKRFAMRDARLAKLLPRDAVAMTL